MNKFPKKGELVIITIKKIMKYGAFVDLDEYKNIEGFLHISEIENKWVKNINQVIRTGKKDVALVIDVEPGKNIVDVSLKRVSKDERKRRLEIYNNFKKGYNMVAVALKQAKSKKRPLTIINNIKKYYEDFYDFAQDLLEDETVAKDVDIPKKALPYLKKLLEQTFKPKITEERAKIEIHCYEPNGIELIKQSLEPLSKEAKITYLGGGKYLVTVKGEEEHKKLKKILKNNIEKALKMLNKYDCETSWHLIKKK